MTGCGIQDFMKPQRHWIRIDSSGCEKLQAMGILLKVLLALVVTRAYGVWTGQTCLSWETFCRQRSKIALCHVLLKYEFKLAEGTTPRSREVGFECRLIYRPRFWCAVDRKRYRCQILYVSPMSKCRILNPHSRAPIQIGLLDWILRFGGFF